MVCGGGLDPDERHGSGPWIQVGPVLVHLRYLLGQGTLAAVAAVAAAVAAAMAVAAVVAAAMTVAV